jgi:hypothetical protein
MQISMGRNCRFHTANISPGEAGKDVDDPFCDSDFSAGIFSTLPFGDRFCFFGDHKSFRVSRNATGRE